MTADLQPDSADVSWPTSGALLIARRSAAAVRAIGGTERSGQAEMADAVADAFDTGTHLLVQAGTGTGKSLGYLVPALTWLTQHPGERIVVATATLALQSQLADKDIPVALDAVEQVTGHRPVHAILKGRTNYACLLRVRDATSAHQGTLLSAAELAGTMPSSTPGAPESALGAEVVGLRNGQKSRQPPTGLRIAIRHRRIPNEAGSRFPSLFGSVLGPSAARTGTHASSRNRGMPLARRT